MFAGHAARDPAPWQRLSSPRPGARAARLRVCRGSDAVRGVSVQTSLSPARGALQGRAVLAWGHRAIAVRMTCHPHRLVGPGQVEMVERYLNNLFCKICNSFKINYSDNIFLTTQPAVTAGTGLGRDTYFRHPHLQRKTQGKYQYNECPEQGTSRPFQPQPWAHGRCCSGPITCGDCGAVHAWYPGFHGKAGLKCQINKHQKVLC